MKNNSRDNLREQAEKIGNEMASELDRCATDENLAEIKERISDLIIFRKKRTVKKRLTALVATLLALLLLIGGITVYRLKVQLADNGNHSAIISLIPDNLFRYMIDVPEHYQLSAATSIKGSAKASFENGDYVLVFTESKLSISIDTEQAEARTVMLPNGYEGIYIEKNGVTLFWQQQGYYYLLHTNDVSLDLIEIAATLKK